MPDMSKIRLKETEYWFKDNAARSRIGDLSDLATQNKDSIVGAINELNGSRGESAVLYTEQNLTDEERRQARDNIGVGATIADTLIDLNLVVPMSEDDGDVLSTADGVILVEGGPEPPFIRTLNRVKPDLDGNINVVTSVNGMTGDVVIEAGGASSWNDLADKPFGEEVNTHSLTWNCSPDGLESASPSDSVTMYKISDDIISNGAYDTCTISIEDLDGTVAGSDTISSDSFEYVSELDLLCIISNELGFILYCVPADGAPLTDTVSVSGGVWVAALSGADTLSDSTMNITFSKSNLWQIEEKYIPDTIARSADVAQADMSQSNESAPDYIKNRTHWSDSGNITILKEVSVEFGLYDGTAATLINRRVVLDAARLNVLVDNSDITSSYCTVLWNGTEYGATPINGYRETDDQISWNIGDYNLASNPVYENGSYPFFIQRTKNTLTGEDSITIWAKGSDAFDVTVSITGYGVAYTQLNDRFIPDNIARKHDVVTDWGELINTPFDKSTSRVTLVYDGVTDGRDYVLVNAGANSYGGNYYKVSDDIIPFNINVVGLTRTQADNRTHLLSSGLQGGDGVECYGTNIVVLNIRSTNFTLFGNSYTAPSTGVYFWGEAGVGNGYCSSFTYEVKEETLKPDCLPKVSAVPDATGETVSAAEFNALLAALRDAGYLSA